MATDAPSVVEEKVEQLARQWTGQRGVRNTPAAGRGAKTRLPFRLRDRVAPEPGLPLISGMRPVTPNRRQK